MTCPQCYPGPTRGLHCDFCLRHVYRVQNRDGERFLVDHYGKRGCPAR